LLLVLPAMGGCIIAEDGEYRHHHAHCYGCHHIFRGGVWIVG
jgi:hypothetical protein